MPVWLSISKGGFPSILVRASGRFGRELPHPQVGCSFSGPFPSRGRAVSLPPSPTVDFSFGGPTVLPRSSADALPRSYIGYEHAQFRRSPLQAFKCSPPPLRYLFVLVYGLTCRIDSSAHSLLFYATYPARRQFSCRV